MQHIKHNELKCNKIDDKFDRNIEQNVSVCQNGKVNKIRVYAE